MLGGMLALTAAGAHSFPARPASYQAQVDNLLGRLLGVEAPAPVQLQ